MPMMQRQRIIIAGPPGPAGIDGKDGSAGGPGAAGRDGKDGLPGAPGRDGLAGKDGLPGAAGRDGKDALPNFRTARLVLPAIALGVGLSFTLLWTYQGGVLPFDNDKITINPPCVVGPAGVKLGLVVTAVTPSGCTVLVTATALLPANTATLHISAIHD